jgi:hypothetical protein
MLSSNVFIYDYISCLTICGILNLPCQHENLIVCKIHNFKLLIRYMSSVVCFLYRLLFENSASRLFNENGQLRVDFSKRKAKEFFHFGQITALALLHGCAGPRLFCDSQASFIVGKPCVNINDMTEERKTKLAVVSWCQKP